MSWFSFGWSEKNTKETQKKVLYSWESIPYKLLGSYLKDLYTEQYNAKALKMKHGIDHEQKPLDIERQFLTKFNLYILSPVTSDLCRRPPEEFRPKFLQLTKQLFDCYCQDLNANLVNPSESTFKHLMLYADYVNELYIIARTHGDITRGHPSVAKYYQMSFDEDLDIVKKRL